MQQVEPKIIFKTAKKTANIHFSIFFLGTIGGVAICILEFLRRIRFQNYARLPLWEGKIVLASNHPSWLDIVIIPLLYFPWWYRELGNRFKEILLSPFKAFRREKLDNVFVRDFKDIPVSTADKHNFRHFSWVLEGWNIFINRKDGEIGERGGALKRAIDVLENEGRIIIFPGGGRDFKANGDGIYDMNTQQLIMRQPRPGIGWIVKRTGATVVPIRIEGADKTLPNEPNRKLPPFLRFERYFLRFWHPITIKVGEPLRFERGVDEDEVSKRFVEAQISLHLENGTNGHRKNGVVPYFNGYNKNLLDALFPRLPVG